MIYFFSIIVVYDKYTDHRLATLVTIDRYDHISVKSDRSYRRNDEKQEKETEKWLNHDHCRIRSRNLDFAMSGPRPRNYGGSMVYWPARQLNCSLYWASLRNPWRVVADEERKREYGGKEKRIQRDARGDSSEPPQTRRTTHRLQLNQTKLRAGKWIIIGDRQEIQASPRLIYVVGVFTAISCPPN